MGTRRGNCCILLSCDVTENFFNYVVGVQLPLKVFQCKRLERFDMKLIRKGGLSVSAQFLLRPEKPQQHASVASLYIDLHEHGSGRSR